MPTHEITAVRPPSTMSDPSGRGPNIVYSGVEYRSNRAPEYHAYLFNISARTFKEVGSRRMTIPGVDADKDPSFDELGPNHHYRYVSSFPQPMIVPKFDDMSSEIATAELDVRRFLVDQLQPDNLGLQLVDAIAPERTFSVGTDYAQKGVFFSLSNPPARADIEAAFRRMEKYYQALLDEASVLELTDKVQLSEKLRGNPDFAFAASYFGREVSWNRKPERPSVCPNCGQSKPATAHFHMAPFGICIEPSVEGWRAAVNAGAKKYSDVPDEFRWKGEKALAGKMDKDDQ